MDFPTIMPRNPNKSQVGTFPLKAPGIRVCPDQGQILWNLQHVVIFIEFLNERTINTAPAIQPLLFRGGNQSLERSCFLRAAHSFLEELITEFRFMTPREVSIPFGLSLRNSGSKTLKKKGGREKMAKECPL